MPEVCIVGGTRASCLVESCCISFHCTDLCFVPMKSCAAGVYVMNNPLLSMHKLDGCTHATTDLCSCA